MPQATFVCFSMEMAIRSEIPTYAGGRGVLTGDTIPAAADAGFLVAAVTLLHRLGYFLKTNSDDGLPTEEPVRWEPVHQLRELGPA